MNLWRNIDDIHPIVDDHLAVLDQRSLTTGVGSEVCQKNMSCWVRGMLEQYVMLDQRCVKSICHVGSEVCQNNMSCGVKFQLADISMTLTN